MTSIKTRIAKLAAAYAARKDAASGKPLLTGGKPRMYTNEARTESLEIGSVEWRAWMIAHGEEVPPEPASGSYH